MSAILEVKDLHVSIGGEEILRGVYLTVNAGEVHAIMGPNGSGKSTLASVIAGRPEYDVTQGEVLFEGRDLLALTPDARAREGVFLAFQYPVELPGVRNRQFLKSAVNAIRRHRGEKDLTAREFDKVFRANVKQVGIDPDLLKRSVNEGFSGGEKKRSEMLQLAILDPKLALLDETDSGLDIDALRAIADGVNKRRAPDKAIVLITHYQRILNYITPDHIHVLIGGRILMRGGPDLALQLESKGYDWVKESAAPQVAVSGA
jgi:Fe-S cluster assembly ATP-binding protein